MINFANGSTIRSKNIWFNIRNDEDTELFGVIK